MKNKMECLGVGLIWCWQTSMNERTHFFYKTYISLTLYSRKAWCFCDVWEMGGETYTQRGDFFFPYLLLGASGCQRLHPIFGKGYYNRHNVHLFSGSLRGAMVKILGCENVLNEFEFQSRNYVPFQTNTLGEKHELPNSPSYGLNSITYGR